MPTDKMSLAQFARRTKQNYATLYSRIHANPMYSQMPAEYRGRTSGASRVMTEKQWRVVTAKPKRGRPKGR